MSEMLGDAPPPYGTIVFDCDSTLSGIEGIDELAGDARAEIERLTGLAMDGALPLEEVYGRRLALLRPGRGAVRALAGRYAAEMLPNVDLLLAALAALGKRVAVVSGGLLPAVLPFAARLGVKAQDVYAVDIGFDAQGGYAGFDERSPLARSGGKVEVLAEIARAPGAGALCFVGDGMTDLEAAGCAARFVAFGGVVRRAEVFERARVRCAERDYAALAPLLLAPAEIDALRAHGRFAPLLAAAAPHMRS